jgi:hypothetical protein
VAETIRFRAVVLGEPPHEGQVFFIAEDSDGTLYFRDAEWDWPLLATALEDVTPADVPDNYQRFRAVTRILPVREAVGPDLPGAHSDLMKQIEVLAESGVPAGAAAAATT